MSESDTQESQTLSTRTAVLVLQDLLNRMPLHILGGIYSEANKLRRKGDSSGKILSKQTLLAMSRHNDDVRCDSCREAAESLLDRWPNLEMEGYDVVDATTIIQSLTHQKIHTTDRNQEVSP